LPCWEQGKRRKHPRIAHGFHAASNDPALIEAWWTKWPQALIGVATGASGLAVLDVDVKDPKKYGPDSLEDLGRSCLDVTWIAHTASGGWHAYYDALEADIPSTSHTIGPGLDVRASTGYIIAPAPGSGYVWDLRYHPGMVPLAPAPAWLIPPPPKPETITRAKPIKPCVGLSPYADAAIEHACQAIRHAGNGRQREVLRDESFSIGTLAGAGGIPESFARAALIDAGCGMPSYNPKKPWTEKEIRRVVKGAFDAGVARPRPTTSRSAWR
jgi:putative DNA primase/helicase